MEAKHQTTKPDSNDLLDYVVRSKHGTYSTSNPITRVEADKFLQRIIRSEGGKTKSDAKLFIRYTSYKEVV